ncbi:MAG TPA: hypothetical protein VD931_22905 [Baekduia sp.]|nr:hypothetical protein [Baekduia sp.]
MRVDDFDADVLTLVRRLRSAGVQFVVLEDEDDGLTVVPGPARRNVERAARLLERSGARLSGPGPKLDFGEIGRGRPGRWPLDVGGVALDLMVVGLDDGRWTTYFDEAVPFEIEAGLKVLAVPDRPIISVRRADAREAMPELALTQRERDDLRRRRRRETLRSERRAARRASIRRLAGRR